MVESEPAAEATTRDGVLAGASGLLTVAVGVAVAPAYPVLASVLVGLPAGFAAWVALRELAGRTVGWPLADADPAADRPGAVTEEDCPPG